jgi:hypothetical protein
MGRRASSIMVSAVCLVTLTVASPAHAIVGGTDVTDPSAWPSLVLLQGPADESGRSTYCSGTVIRTHWVLTAAHCFLDAAHGSEPLPAGNWQARVGWLSDTQRNGTAHPADHVYVDPSYTGGKAHDIALLHLPGGTSARPIPIATRAQTADALSQPHVAVGYGAPYDRNGFPLLRQLTIPGRLSRTGATLKLSKLDTKRNVSPGDSGGPLFARASDGGWVQLGSVQGMHRDCFVCDPYDIFSNLSHPGISEWLTHIVAVPSPPVNLVASGIAGGVRLTWEPPKESGDGSLTGYVVEWDDGLANQTRTVSADRLTFDVNGLVAGAGYTFMVSARNAFGQGLPASTSGVAGRAVALAYGSAGWSFLQVPYGEQAGFQAPSFDASSWPTGQAGFGTTDGTCPWNNVHQVHTGWTPGTDMLLRHEFTVPPDVRHVSIAGTVDNDADVYVNGDLLQQVASGNCLADGINVDVPLGLLMTTNVIAIRARDVGVSAFIDVQVTYAP